jgi:hypothetical protein
MDNAPIHSSRMSQNFLGHDPPKRPPHPSPPDFDLFGKVKSVLIGREISEEIDVLESARGF